MSNPEYTGDFGTIDLPALRRIRDLWIDLEPLVEHAEYDDPIARRKYRSSWPMVSPMPVRPGSTSSGAGSGTTRITTWTAGT
jgi:hypothetical protein